ncbi:hypothetical protein [Sphingobium sp. BS19]|uniref:hypothetical protein n=1 Tax=Sphingobium sp. BS19 TaxID=3018973 RepID=UPI002490E6CA|nr:hypothetical protein [Sphingobium sp. BS19]
MDIQIGHNCSDGVQTGAPVHHRAAGFANGAEVACVGILASGFNHPHGGRARLAALETIEHSRWAGPFRLLALSFKVVAEFMA